MADEVEKTFTELLKCARNEGGRGIDEFTHVLVAFQRALKGGCCKQRTVDRLSEVIREYLVQDPRYQRRMNAFLRQSDSSYADLPGKAYLES